MKAKNLILAIVGGIVLTASSANGDIISVQITGTVEWNMITGAGRPLSSVTVGAPATLDFVVDSDVFLNNPMYPTRGYPIDHSSFQLSFPTVSVGLQNPYPAGQTPYFVLRNNDPAVDGFFISTGTGFFDGVPTDQVGAFENFANEFHVTYGGSRLSSLDILGAQGTYDYTGLTVYNWTLDDGPFNALGINFTQMTITPEPATLVLLSMGCLAVIRRRRSFQGVRA